MYHSNLNYRGAVASGLSYCITYYNEGAHKRFSRGTNATHLLPCNPHFFELGNGVIHVPHVHQHHQRHPRQTARREVGGMKISPTLAYDRNSGSKRSPKQGETPWLCTRRLHGAVLLPDPLAHTCEFSYNRLRCISHIVCESYRNLT